MSGPLGFFMQITGNLQIRATAGEALLVARIDHEIARVQALSDAGIEALCPLLDAMDTGDVVRKIARFVVASASPGAVLARVYEREPERLAELCVQLTAYRTYMARITGGDTPVQAAAYAERTRRDWLARAVRTHHVGEEPAPLEPPDPPHPDVRARPPAPDTGGLDMDYEPIDVYDAEGALDEGAVRAEVERLLRRLNVPPACIELRVVPDELPRSD